MSSLRELEDGETIPEPSAFDAVRAMRDYRDGMPVLVPLRTDALSMRINVTLPAAVLRRIDDYAEDEGLTRSAFLATAARHELARVQTKTGHAKREAAKAKTKR